jgi:hypothetical protein
LKRRIAKLHTNGIHFIDIFKVNLKLRQNKMMRNREEKNPFIHFQSFQTQREACCLQFGHQKQ